MKEIFLPVTDVERSIGWFNNIFDVQLGRRDEQTGEISFANKTSIVLVKSDELNEYTHIPFNLESHNMIKSRSRLIEKGVSVSKSSISDSFHCLDFFDPDGNRLGLVGAEIPDHKNADEQLSVCATFLAVKKIDLAIKWYSEIFGLSFRSWSFRGGAGYNSDTYEHDLTIKYAASNFPQGGGITLAETPKVNPLVHIPYILQTSNASHLYKKLQSNDVHISKYQRDNQCNYFEFADIEGNQIGVREELS
jgi:predicted enzyme related to lactoylglutathione lyase